jgi:hypothetical protein
MSSASVAPEPRLLLLQAKKARLEKNLTRALTKLIVVCTNFQGLETNTFFC